MNVKKDKLLYFDNILKKKGRSVDRPFLLNNNQITYSQLIYETLVRLKL